MTEHSVLDCKDINNIDDSILSIFSYLDNRYFDSVCVRCYSTCIIVEKLYNKTHYKIYIYIDPSTMKDIFYLSPPIYPSDISNIVKRLIIRSI